MDSLTGILKEFITITTGYNTNDATGNDLPAAYPGPLKICDVAVPQIARTRMHVSCDISCCVHDPRALSHGTEEHDDALRDVGFAVWPPEIVPRKFCPGYRVYARDRVCGSHETPPRGCTRLSVAAVYFSTTSVAERMANECCKSFYGTV